MEGTNWSKRLRLSQGALVLVGAVGLGAVVTRAFAGPARAAPATPAPTAGTSAPAQSVTVTPKTERPAAAETLSKAFATTAKALRPSVVRIDVEMGAPGQAQLGREDHQRQGGQRGQGRQHGQGGQAAPSPFSEDEPEGLPPELKEFFQFGPGGSPNEIAPPSGHGTGSGVIIDAAGDIVTNSHVVEHATKVTATLEGGAEIPARVVGRDPETDLAVVRLQRVPPGLVVARLGNSDALDVGDWVLAIGSPLGLDQTVTAGIVSGKGHVGPHVQMSGDRVRNYISTDAMINPGNSGGPLVNLDGEVVGINTLINTGPGGAYGFAIPINEATRVTKTLLAGGHMRYPYLGVQIGDVAKVPPNEKEKLGPNPPENGAFVSEVKEGSPAAKAGLRAGDIITAIDGKPISSAADVIDTVSARSIGSKVGVQVLREGKPENVRVALGELPSPDSEVAVDEAGSAGMALQTVTPELAQSLGLPAETHGAAVTDVSTGSPAARAGVKPGDVVVEVDRQPVATAKAAATAVQQPRAKGHLVRVLGEHGSRFVTLPTG
jgi:serine protease Do